MNDYTSNNKRIAKNTLYMYSRMIVIMVVSLFTSRLVLQTLGVDNYGTYNIVGSIVVFFSFINNGLGFATKRYITSDIADGNIEKGRHTFNVCLTAHVLIAGIVFMISEIVGTYAIHRYLNIPEGREFAAQIVYQISVFTAILGVLQSPFSTAIVAYEDMSVYAYFSIIDVFLKLCIIFLVQTIDADKLILYAILVMCVNIINMSYFVAYSLHKYPICHIERTKNRPLLKDIFGFMGWNVMGQSVTVLTNQGVSVLVNMFFNVAVNAAMGISNTITNVVTQFVSNFQIAFNPQIIKSYNTGDYRYLQSLIFRSSKLTSFLILLFIVPLIFEAETVLTLWLSEYPQYSVEFCVCTLFCIYIDSISAPLYMVMYAQTNIRKYQIIISSVYSLCFILGWVALLLHLPPYSVIIARFFVYIALLAVRLMFVKKLLDGFEIIEWIKQILGKSIFILAASALITGLASAHLHTNDFVHLLTVSFVSVIVNISLMFYIGFSKTERQYVTNIFKQWSKKS